MIGAFYIFGAVAVIATFMVIISANAVHALLYLVVSLLAVAGVFYVLGAPFAAALEVIVYAGAIMVLFVFVVMMLNLGPESVRRERSWLSFRMYIGPALLCAVLLGQLIYVLSSGEAYVATGHEVGPKAVGIRLFGPYLLAVELASMLLLAGLVGAYHLGRRDQHDSKDREP